MKRKKNMNVVEVDRNLIPNPVPHSHTFLDGEYTLTNISLSHE